MYLQQPESAQLKQKINNFIAFLILKHSVSIVLLACNVKTYIDS